MLNQFLLRNKRDNQQEYTIHLFEFCNLNCSFCWQDHSNINGIDTVREKLKPIEDFLKTEERDRVVFNIMGGEIFADDILSETLAQEYIDFANQIKSLCLEYEKQCAINWVTNLVFTKTDLVRKILNNGGSLVTSYDSRGRFDRGSKKIFLENLYAFRDFVEGVGIVLTKQNAQHLSHRVDETFQQMYDDGFYIYADYYMPDENAKHQAPTDQDLLDFFKKAIDVWPKIHPIADWIEKEENFISCRTSKLVLDDGTMCFCGNLVQEDQSMYSSDIQKMDNNEIENRFLEKYDCASCEFFRRCTLGCFMQHDYKWREELPECVYKLAFRYIDMKNGVIARG